MVFTYLGIEHVRATPEAIHLDFLPYSHSLFTGALLAALAWGMGKSVHREYVGRAISLGIFSHIVLDIIHHEPNLTLLPLPWGPRFGLNLQGYPLLDLLVEVGFCVACWKLFGGSKGLLIGIVIFNLLNVPLMFLPAGALTLIASNHALLPTIILVQIVSSWLLVWWLGREKVIR
ncbi:MAG: hypothetical protein M3P12_08900 [Gemmatimonadota bacterium]|nr:hypothetical protein [Gemmatimonadota bacterium]